MKLPTPNSLKTFRNWTVAASADTPFPTQFVHYAGEASLTYDQAKYVEHAANAYPKLVEALRQLADANGSVAKARELLSELGETA